MAVYGKFTALCPGIEDIVEEENLRMSQHSSLKGSGKIIARRNVLKRFERVNVLKERGLWKDGDRGLGLIKTKPED